MTLQIPAHINEENPFIRTADFYSHALLEWFLSYNLVLKAAPPLFNVAAVAFYFVDTAVFAAAQHTYFASRKNSVQPRDPGGSIDPDDMLMLVTDANVEWMTVQARAVRNASELAYNLLLFGLVGTSGYALGLLMVGYYAAYVAKRSMVHDERSSLLSSLLEPALATAIFALRYVAGPTKGMLISAYGISCVIKWACVSTGYNIMTREDPYNQILDQIAERQEKESAETEPEQKPAPV